MQRVRHQAADGRFARPHETDQRKILDLTRGEHGIDLADISGRSNQRKHLWPGA